MFKDTREVHRVFEKDVQNRHELRGRGSKRNAENNRSRGKRIRAS